MSLLLDTHAFLWWLNDDPKLGARARVAIADPHNVVFVSAATAWEIAVKRAAGKLTAPGSITHWIGDTGFLDLAVEANHAVASAELPRHHADPFDRVLVAQAQIEGLRIVTSDERIRQYDVETLDAAT